MSAQFCFGQRVKLLRTVETRRISTHYRILRKNYRSDSKSDCAIVFSASRSSRWTFRRRLEVRNEKFYRYEFFFSKSKRDFFRFRTPKFRRISIVRLIYTYVVLARDELYPRCELIFESYDALRFYGASKTAKSGFFRPSRSNYEKTTRPIRKRIAPSFLARRVL